MRKFILSRISFIGLMLLYILMVLMFTGCRSKKTALEKKEEIVSTLDKKDIKTTEKAKIETSTFTLSDSEGWTVTPMNEEKEVTVIKGKDTLKFTGATINFSKDKTETTSKILEQNTRDLTDNSTSSTDSKKTEKKHDTQVKSSSWGANLATIFGVIFLIIAVACGVYLHFNTPKNPLV